MAEFHYILLLATILAHLLLGTLVFIKKRGLPLTRIMISFSLSTAAWAFAVLMVTWSGDYQKMLFWVRATYAMGIMVIWHVYALSVSFPSGRPLKTRLDQFILFFTVVLFFLSFSSYLVPAIASPLALKNPAFGVLFFPYVSCYSILVLVALSRLYQKARVARGLQKMQFRYFFGGISVSLLLSSLANVVLPLLGYNEIAGFDIRPLGPVFSTIMVGTVTYAIVRYRFMDMRLAFRKIFATAVAVLVFSGLFILFIWLIRTKAAGLTGFGADLVIVLFAMLLLGTFLPFRNVTQKFFDHFIFRKTYDYHASLIDKIDELTTLLDPDQLTASLVTEIVKEIDLESGYYYNLVNQKAFYCMHGNQHVLSGYLASREFSAMVSRLLSFLKDNKEIVALVDFDRQKPDLPASGLQKEMSSLKIDLVVPMLTASVPEGLIMLGPKMSGEPYFKEDIQLLAILSAQVASALKNARLYQDLLETKHYLESVIANMGNGLIAVDDEGKITVFNSEAAFMTALNPEEVLGKKAKDFLNAQLYKLYQDTLRKGQTSHGVEIVMGQGTEKYYLSCHTSLFEPKEAAHREVIIVLSNITPIKELEEEKSQAQRLASLGEMVAGIAHEIKNPLVSIKTFAELLPEKYDDEYFRHSYAAIVSKEITRINNLVTEMLDFVKHNTVVLERFAASNLLDEVLSLLSSPLQKNGIRVEKNYAAKMPPVEADYSLLKQALLNIAENAVQAMPEGGTLKVGLKYLPEKGRIKEPYQAGVCFIIEDTGEGIDQEISANLFAPFVTSKADGVGLGLSVSQKIVLAHKGKITCSSPEEGGARFEILLPVSGQA